MNLASTFPFVRTGRDPQSELDARVVEVRRLAVLVRDRGGEAALRKAWQAACDDAVVSMIRTEPDMRVHWGSLEKLVTSLLLNPSQRGRDAEGRQ